MTELVVFILATCGFVALNSFQKRYFPATYAEPINMTYGLDPHLSTAKIFTRFGLPFVVGLFVGVSPTPYRVEVASLVCFFAPLILVYPQLVDFRLLPPFAYRRTKAARIGYFLFAFFNGALGLLGALLSSALLRVAIEVSLQSPILDLAARAVNREIILPNVLGSVVAIVLVSLFLWLWRRSVRAIRRQR